MTASNSNASSPDSSPPEAGIVTVQFREPETLERKKDAEERQVATDSRRESIGVNGEEIGETFVFTGSPPELRDEEAREALMEHVRYRYCYGKTAAKKLTIDKINHTNAFHYTIESFTEKRTTSWALEPYQGGDVDGPENGPEPDPWDVEVTPPEKFVLTHKTDVEMPHTASIKTCHSCAGVGRKRCDVCKGGGTEDCYSCKGVGSRVMNIQGDTDICYRCSGSGKRNCWRCNGDGMIQCTVCNGAGQIKCFLKLTVIWTTHSDEKTVESNPIPNGAIKSVSGYLAYQEELPKWVSHVNFSDPKVTKASKTVQRQHSQSLQDEKLLYQRQKVRVIPVSTVHYTWKGKPGTFTVYGTERKVYAPKYPQSCFLGCCMM